MDKKVDIAIIGAGTAGISAFKEASKYTKNIVMIDKGPLGSTCARIGCMPSKLLIHTANEFHKRMHFKKIGIQGADKLTIDIRAVLNYVRTMRDEFTSGVVKYVQSLNEQFVCGEAKFIDVHTLKIDNHKIHAKKIIIATGTKSLVPKVFQSFSTQLLTTENIFEQETLSESISVIGAGVIGLELGQALARLNIDTTLFHSKEFIGGLTDPIVNKTAVEIFKNEFPIYLNEMVGPVRNEKGELYIESSSLKKYASQVLVAAGRAPDLKNLDLEKLDLQLDSSGVPSYNKSTMQIGNLPLFIAGDVNKFRPLLHEAADEGRIAGFNAAHDKAHCFNLRVPIRILFTTPNIFVVGNSLVALNQKDFVIGEVDYSDQGRAKILNQNQGMLRVYGEHETGRLLGAEGIAPGGEHLAHLLSWAMQKEMTVFELLKMPFYHPVLEEGMRTALRDLSKKVMKERKNSELVMCNSEAIKTLS